MRMYICVRKMCEKKKVKEIQKIFKYFSKLEMFQEFLLNIKEHALYFV